MCRNILKLVMYMSTFLISSYHVKSYQIISKFDSFIIHKHFVLLKNIHFLVGEFVELKIIIYKYYFQNKKYYRYY